MHYACIESLDITDICVKTTYLATRKKFRTLFRNKEKSYKDKLFDKLKFILAVC